jgi:transposase
MKKVMAGIDLHSNNLVIGIIDSEGKRLLHRKLDCQLNKVMALLGPYKQQLQTVAVESTYNWYWLVDGLRAAGYPTVLANPAKIDPYRGLKHADDQNDAFFLAQLARLRILPTGYIYEPQLRPVRDLLRRRLSLVHQRTALMLSFKSLFTRTTGQQMKLRRLKTLSAEEAKALYEHPANQLVAQVQHRHIQALKESIEQIEAVVLKAARALPYYARLTTLPGVGIILGLTITMGGFVITRWHPLPPMINYPSIAKFQQFVELKDFRPPTKKEYVRYVRKRAEHFGSVRLNRDELLWSYSTCSKTEHVVVGASSMSPCIRADGEGAARSGRLPVTKN